MLIQNRCYSNYGVCMKFKSNLSRFQAAAFPEWKEYAFALLCLMALVMLVLTGCSEKAAVYQPAVAKLVERAAEFKNANQPQEAICRLEAAADIAPDSYQVQYNLGILYSEAQRWEPAINHLKQALEISPNQANALYTLAFTYESQGDQLMQYANITDPKELEGLNMPESVKALSKEDARSKGQEAYQSALGTYQTFLEKAPGNDPSRGQVESHLNMLQSKIAAPPASSAY